MPNEAETRPSKKQRELLSFIDGFIQGHGYGPSYREIMRSLGYKSVSTVAIHVDNLITKGYLTKLDHSARSLSVTSNKPKTTLAASGTSSKNANWLIAEVKGRFEAYQKSPSPQQLDELFVLVGALHVLGLEDAALSYKSQLKQFKTD